MKYLITCLEERENGKLIFPQIQQVITADNIHKAEQYAYERYDKYRKIIVCQWSKENGNV